jgi:energy-coupling factor transporter ATP-binding protein EcfA2
MAIVQTVALPYPSTEKVTSTFAVGATLKVQYKTYQVMSDIWEQGLCAEYWDEASQSVKTADWCDSGCTVDATPEVVAKAEAWVYSRAYDRALEKLIMAEATEAQRIVKECRVRVVSGRTSKGVEGKVVVVLQRPYGMGYRSTVEDKLGIATSEVKVKVPAANGRVYENYRDVVWIWSRNCERLDIPAVDLESIKEAAKNEAQYEVSGRRWSSPARSK